MLAGAALQFGPAQAANAPQIGPVPSWVEKSPDNPPEKADLAGLPVVILLHDVQFSFDAAGWSEFHEVRAKVQTAAGLQGLGAIPYLWSPDSDTLTFHHANIVRDGQTIDTLPKDGAFTVLRRETGLEQATLTGQLTAVLQPEGLQVGDVLDIAISIRHTDPLFKSRSTALFAGWDGAPVGRLRLEARWPSSLAMRWRETSDLPPLRRSETRGVTTVALDTDDVRPPILPAHAPARFQHGRQIEFTTFGDWKAVAELMAPLYAKAAELGPQSPVAAQAALIAKTTSDPKARASAALRLVQADVRYLAHMEASGGYTPQSADETWRLRYGDCKAKTVLLLALLRELGVPATPVLANLAAGDAVADHLPSALMFNHVLVRVTLGQKDYWLDGARQGDRNLDDLTTPDYGWVLPFDTTDSRLVHLVPAPATQPQVLQVIRYDASGGVTDPEPTELETTFRGDAGALLHVQLSAVPPDRMDAALKAYWSTVHTAFTAAHVSASWDPATGEEKLVASGTSKLDWSGAGLELQHVALGGAPDIKRDPASRDPDAPYVVDFPSYVETDESVVLPPGTKLTAEIAKAADVDTVIAGVSYRRTGTVTGNVFRVVATQRTLQPEITASEARASVDPLTKLGEQGVYAPAGASKQAANDAYEIDKHPTTADGHIERGNALANERRFPEALVELDAAIALDPKSQRAWADRAIAHAWLADRAAIADADKADALGPPEIVAARARGVLATQTGDFEGARAAYRRALALAPDDDFTLGKLVYLDLRKSDAAAARSDLDHLVRSHPELAQNAHLWRASIEMLEHHNEGAERELALAPTTTSEEFLNRAGAYLAMGDKALARADLDGSIRLKPTIIAWLLRASIDGGLGSPGADSDVEAAAKIAPDDVGAQLRKINAAYARRDYAAAVPFIERVEKKLPELASLQWYDLRSKVGSSTPGPAGSAPAGAQPATPAPGAAFPDADQSRLCQGQTSGANAVAPDQKIAGCTWVLKNGGLDARRTSAAYILRSLGYSANNQVDRQLADLDSAVKSDPSFSRAWAESCSAHNWKDEIDRAVKECATAISLDPKSAEALTYRGDVYLHSKRYDLAIKDYDAAIALEPTWMWPWVNRGEAYVRSGQIEKAVNDFEQVMRIAPDYAMGWLDRGIARIRLGRIALAQSDFDRGVQIDPHCADCIYGRGVTKRLSGDLAGGAADIAAATAMSPKAAQNFEEDGVKAP